VTRTARTTVLAALTALLATAALAPAAPAAQPAGHQRPDRWELVSAAALGQETHASSIAAAGPRAAWIAGTRWDAGGHPEGVVLTWRDGAWHEDRTPGLPATDYWSSVDATGRDDAWVYGWSMDTGEALAHYDGDSWQPVPLPGGGGHYGELAAAPGRVWLAGDNRISTFADGAWESTPMDRGVSVRAVDARTARDAWAVGTRYRGLAADPVVLHWDGTGWRDASPDLGGMQLTAVHAESRTSVWAVGVPDGTVEDNWFQPRVLHWDGSAWSDVTGPLTGFQPQAVAADGAGRVWVSGDPEGWEGPPVYWRYDGRAWTRVDGPTTPGSAPTQAYEVTDLAPIGRTGRFWAVGTYEFVEGTTAHGREFVHRSR
jgi:hypothetical protein